jgi:4-amino-4-deoxy-L-arabinose transferase-like glycosyltransferase
MRQFKSNSNLFRKSVKRQRMKQPRTKNWLILLIFILIFGLLFRGYFFVDDWFIGTDAAIYTKLGENYIENGEYQFGENYNLGIISAPGYPILVGIVNILFDNLLLSGKLVSLLFGLFSIVLFYLIGKELHSKEAGLFAALALAAYPFSAHISGIASTESMFGFFAFLAIYVFILIYKKRISLRLTAILSVSIAIAYLTKPEGLLLLILLPLIFILKAKQCKKSKNYEDWKKVMIKLLIAIILFSMIISPYILFLKNNTGQITYSGKKGLNVVMGEAFNTLEYEKSVYSLNKNKDQIELYEKNMELSLGDYIKENPKQFIKRFITNLLKALKYLVILALPFLVPLVFFIFYKKLFRDKSLWGLIIILTLFLFAYSLFYIIIRFMYPLMLILMVLAGIGYCNSRQNLFKVLKHYKIKRNFLITFVNKYLKTTMIFVLLCSSIFYVGAYALLSESKPNEHIEAGLFLKELHGLDIENINVMSRKPWISFYSGSKYTTLPYATPKEIINFAKLHQVDYIVIGERELSKWRNYDKIINLNVYDEKIELIKVFESKESKKKINFIKNPKNKIIKIFRINY